MTIDIILRLFSLIVFGLILVIVVAGGLILISKEFTHDPCARERTSMTSTMEQIRSYWRDPNDGQNIFNNYQSERAYKRSNYLLSLINHLPRESKIIELGSGVGRNLSVLYNAGFRNLNGVEISEKAINLMRESYPELRTCKIYHNPIESIIDILPDKEYDLVFTMAVLEHLPFESNWVFAEISRICKVNLITIEDEYTQSWRHFPRNYKEIFEDLGFKQKNYKILTPRQGLFLKFRCRFFIKND